MVTVRQALAALESLAPPEMKQTWDNVGLLCGRLGGSAERILAALDVTDWVIEEAAARGVNLIAAHHPLVRELTAVTDAEPVGRKLLTLAEHGIAVICMHTNLDAAPGGVNDALAQAAGLQNTELLWEDGRLADGTAYGIGRVGQLPQACPLADYLPRLSRALSAPGLRYWDAGKPVRRVAVVGGSGGSDLPHVLARGCDTFVTADVKHNVWQEAREAGLNLIDGGHFATENVVVLPLARYLRAALPDAQVYVSESNGPTEHFFVG